MSTRMIITMALGETLTMNLAARSMTPITEATQVKIPANTLAHEMGNDRALNMVMLGAVASVTGITSQAALVQALETAFQGKKRVLLEVNRKALEKGAEYISTTN